ncbi:MAG: hypothetical protein NC302_06580 [Bacteroidales bacterium]|nr:hypothetical protein [Bacteroidales bacterium]MCM1415225.1 hypothetical protein [bacterium]MCM1423781.1 hypothetical protein [bacterium]
MEKLYLYHGTDLKNAKKILNGNFKIKKNEEHWLGNGVYFFEDDSLAKWWTTKPTAKFGTSQITTPAVIECQIEIEKQDILDLRCLEDYKFFSEIYKDVYLKQMLYNGSEKPLEIAKLRCAFCDFMQERYQYKMIIGTFYQPKQPYLPTKYGKYFKKFKLPYVEIQYSVFDKSVIVKKEILKMEE